jgi:hypothetical protein
MDLAFKTGMNFGHSAVICYPRRRRQMEKNIKSIIALLEKASGSRPVFSAIAQFCCWNCFPKKADEKPAGCRIADSNGAYVLTISSGAMSTK